MAQIYSDQLDSKSFRLATVSLGTHPDTETQVPSVTLATHPLGPEIEYNALSYTWGPPRNVKDPDDSITIILFNGELYEVQRNLYDALLELQATCPETPVWIDALCINQSSQDERSAQVSVMNQIYGSAARVIVWLGKATPELVAGVKAAERIGTESAHHTVRMLTTQTWDFGSTISNMQEKYGIDPIAEEDAIGLAALFACNYFVRIWIVQEVSLTDNVVILCNGNFTPFDCVCYTAGFLHYSGLYQQVYALVPPPKRGAHVRGDTYMFAAEKIALIRDWCKREKSEWAEGIKTLDLELGLGDTQPKSSEMLLLRFLVTAIAFKSTDPRDIIYGLVGLMKQTAARDGLTFSSDFEPDYSIGVNDLLTAVAKRIIETTDSLAYLGLARIPTCKRLLVFHPEYPISHRFRSTVSLEQTSDPWGF